MYRRMPEDGAYRNWYTLPALAVKLNGISSVRVLMVIAPVSFVPVVILFTYWTTTVCDPEPIQISQARFVSRLPPGSRALVLSPSIETILTYGQHFRSAASLVGFVGSLRQSIWRASIATQAARKHATDTNRQR